MLYSSEKNPIKIMKAKYFYLVTVVSFLLSIPSYAQLTAPFTGSKAECDSLKNTSLAIRAAFARGDVNGILLYHHPNVTKALDYRTYQVGIESLRPGLKGTLDNFTLEFIENNTESLYINGDTAVEQTLFTIKGTPKVNGKPFIFKGRSMIVYVRYKGSPTGWATVREMIQPETAP